MTLLLVSVSGPQQAEIAASAGADIVDVENAAGGSCCAIDAGALRAVRDALAGRSAVAATAGPPGMEPGALSSSVAALAGLGMDYVKIGLVAGPDLATSIARLAQSARMTRLIGVLFADQGLEPTILEEIAAAGFHAALIDIDGLDIDGLRPRRTLPHEPQLDPALAGRFLDCCKANGLKGGIAGTLEPPDVPRLLPAGPDMLGFRGIFRSAGEAAPSAVSLLRGLLPRARAVPAAGAGSQSHRADDDLDRVFVRDFVLPAHIGAYRKEHGARQRVRFGVEAFLRRPKRMPIDMRDVMSYDIITDGIRRIVAEGHVAFVETLAERIAALVLAEPRILRTVVRVEKLDVGDAVVGVEIIRRRNEDGQN